MKKLLSAFICVALCVFTSFSQEYAVKVSAPNGAPSLSLATLAQKNPENYTFVSAETIPAEFASNKADFIIAPINAGAKLFKMGKSTYRLAAVVTWGNLYFASQRKKFKMKDIKKNGITPPEISPKKVEYLAGAANTQSLLLSDKNAIVLTAEPALTAAKMKNQNITSYALNDFFKKSFGFNGFAQAGLFVRSETAENESDAVKSFLRDAEESAKKCTSDVQTVAKAAVELEILPNEKVALSAIPNCAIRFVNAKEAKKIVEQTAKIDIAQYGGVLPSDDFYYGE